MILKFGIVSGLGWLLDFLLFTLGTSFGVPVWIANTVSAAVAVTFVFVASVRKIFLYEGHYVVRKLMAYLAYQVVAIILASLLIELVSSYVGQPIVAKILVTPITFYANFLFMGWLVAGRLKWK